MNGSSIGRAAESTTNRVCATFLTSCAVVSPPKASGVASIRRTASRSRSFTRDVRGELPTDRFHLVLCRNLVFTYYDESLQRLLQARLARRLVSGGALVIGIHETLPAQEASLSVQNAWLGIHVREMET